jgi:hypothetical protein
MHTVTRAGAPGRLPLQPGQDRAEPEQACEDDIPSRDHEPDGTPAGAPSRAHDGDEVERHGQ